jgi:aryl-alcohol dehydrogenase-like predicted oxidoreductase
MHAWDDSVPIEETLRTFKDLVQNGKVHYIGASNLKGWQQQNPQNMNVVYLLRIIYEDQFSMSKSIFGLFPTSSYI